jgi:hypothetical protein
MRVQRVAEDQLDRAEFLSGRGDKMPEGLAVLASMQPQIGMTQLRALRS